MMCPTVMPSYPPGCYEKYILHNYVKDLGFDLSDIGEKIISKKIKINLEDEGLVDLDLLRRSFKEVLNFLGSDSITRYDEVIWYKLNLIDQVINEYTGIGSFKLDNDYLKFIKSYLAIERAVQGGDTIVALFDKDFNWAVEFKLSQENEFMSADIFDSGGRKPKIIDHSK